MTSTLQEQKILRGTRALSDLVPTMSIDTRGQVCPFPAFETAKIVSSASSEDVIQVLTDDKYVALNSLPTVLRLREFDFAVIETPDLYIVKAKRLQNVTKP